MEGLLGYIPHKVNLAKKQVLEDVRCVRWERIENLLHVLQDCPWVSNNWTNRKDWCRSQLTTFKECWTGFFILSQELKKKPSEIVWQIRKACNDLQFPALLNAEQRCLSCSRKTARFAAAVVVCPP